MTRNKAAWKKLGAQRDGTDEKQNKAKQFLFPEKPFFSHTQKKEQNKKRSQNDCYLHAVPNNAEKTNLSPDLTDFRWFTKAQA